MQLARLVVPSLVAALAGCAASRPSRAPAPPASLASPAEELDPCQPPAGGDPALACTAWRGWTRVNAATFVSRGHMKVPVDVYVPAAQLAAYRDRAAPAPVGLRVIKAQRDAAGAVASLTVMAKMPPGYDPAHGDWAYGVYGPDGASAMKRGRLSMCIECHTDAAPRDHLFGPPDAGAPAE